MFRYIKVLFHTRYYCWSKENCSLYRGLRYVEFVISRFHCSWSCNSTVINWLSLTCSIGKLAKGWEFTMPLTWSSKTQWKMQKTSPYEQKQILSQHVWQGDFCFQTLNKNSLSASLVFWQRSFLDFFITWASAWVLSVSRSRDISTSLQKHCKLTSSWTWSTLGINTSII